MKDQELLPWPEHVRRDHPPSLQMWHLHPASNSESENIFLRKMWVEVGPELCEKFT